LKNTRHVKNKKENINQLSGSTDTWLEVHDRYNPNRSAILIDSSKTINK